jgi:hypothetical protein
MRKQKTRRNKLKSRRMVRAFFSGAKINIIVHNIITRILYPLTTENKLRVFIIKASAFCLTWYF